MVDLERKFEFIMDAVSFYSDEKNYQSQEGTPSAIEDDNGRQARKAVSFYKQATGSDAYGVKTSNE